MVPYMQNLDKEIALVTLKATRCYYQTFRETLRIRFDCEDFVQEVFVYLLVYGNAETRNQDIELGAYIFACCKATAYKLLRKERIESISLESENKLGLAIMSELVSPRIKQTYEIRELVDELSQSMPPQVSGVAVIRGRGRGRKSVPLSALNILLHTVKTADSRDEIYDLVVHKETKKPLFKQAFNLFYKGMVDGVNKVLGEGYLVPRYRKPKSTYGKAGKSLTTSESV